MTMIIYEVYDALRSIAPEDKAIQAAVRLSEAVLTHGAGSQICEARSRVGRGGVIISDLQAASLELGAIRNDMRVITWMLAITVVLSFITCLKVFAQ